MVNYLPTVYPFCFWICETNPGAAHNVLSNVEPISPWELGQNSDGPINWAFNITNYFTIPMYFPFPNLQNKATIHIHRSNLGGDQSSK